MLNLCNRFPAGRLRRSGEDRPLLFFLFVTLIYSYAYLRSNQHIQFFPDALQGA